MDKKNKYLNTIIKDLIRRNEELKKKIYEKK